MPRGMRLTIINKDFAKVELNLPYNIIGAAVFFVVGLIIMGVTFWSVFTYGGGWPLLIITGAVWFFGYILGTYKNSLDIDKLEGKITRKRSIGVLYNKVRDVWALERVLKFEAKQLSGYARIPDETALGREMGAEIADVIIPGAGKEDAEYWRDHDTIYMRVERGALVMKLKSGEIINTLILRYPGPPENVAKHVNLFLEGKYETPGTIE